MKKIYSDEGSLIMDEPTEKVLTSIFLKLHHWEFQLCAQFSTLSNHLQNIDNEASAVEGLKWIVFRNRKLKCLMFLSSHNFLTEGPVTDRKNTHIRRFAVACAKNISGFFKTSQLIFEKLPQVQLWP